MELLLALQDGFGLVHVGQHGPQAPPDRVGRQAAKGLEGFIGGQVLLRRQFAS